MDTKDIIKLVGYEFEYLSLCSERIDPERDVHEVLNRVKDEIRAGRPVIVWNAFTNCEWDVVCGFDEAKKQLIGRGSYAGLDEYARADEKRMIKCTDICPTFGAVLVGKRASELNMREAELAALREAVRHAHSRKDAELLKGDKWVFLEGLQCYDRWVRDFTKPEMKRTSGDSYCLGVYRSTHRAASEFMRELVPKYPEVAGCFESAASYFTTEADMLDQCVPLLGWKSPEGPDPERNARATITLGKARESYEYGIMEIGKALEDIPL